MVEVMVPFLDGYPVLGCDVLEDFPRAGGDFVVEHLAPVFHDEHEMVMHEEHRMMVRFEFHCNHPAFTMYD